jgi:hypothetical protein
MPVSEADITVFDIFIIDLARRASGKSAAIGSLKIAEFEQRHRRVCIPLEMLDIR